MGKKGSGIVERVDLLLKERGLSRKALVSAGVIKTVQTVTDWDERGTIPRADVALAAADYLGVSLRWLLTGKDEVGISREQNNLLVKFGNLTGENQRNVLALIDSMLLSVSGEGKKTKRA